MQAWKISNMYFPFDVRTSVIRRYSLHFAVPLYAARWSKKIAWSMYSQCTFSFHRSSMPASCNFGFVARHTRNFPSSSIDGVHCSTLTLVPSSWNWHRFSYTHTHTHMYVVFHSCDFELFNILIYPSSKLLSFDTRRVCASSNILQRLCERIFEQVERRN